MDVTDTPCVRHGAAGAADAELMALATALEAAHRDARRALRSLYAVEDGEIWATWESLEAQEAHAELLSDLCRARGCRVRHLVPLDSAYDYQEDVPPVA